MEDPGTDVAFPDSVIDMMRGNLGQPPGGFPQGIVGKVLKDEKPNTERPGKHLDPVDIEATHKDVIAQLEGKAIDREDLNS